MSYWQTKNSRWIWMDIYLILYKTPCKIRCFYYFSLILPFLFSLFFNKSKSILAEITYLIDNPKIFLLFFFKNLASFYSNFFASYYFFFYSSLILRLFFIACFLRLFFYYLSYLFVFFIFFSLFFLLIIREK